MRTRMNSKSTHNPFSLACAVLSERRSANSKFLSVTKSFIAITAFAAAAALNAGCAINRYILLKEYSAAGQSIATYPLQGATICLKTFSCSPTLTNPDPSSAVFRAPFVLGHSH